MVPKSNSKIIERGKLDRSSK